MRIQGRTRLNPGWFINVLSGRYRLQQRPFQVEGWARDGDARIAGAKAQTKTPALPRIDLGFAGAGWARLDMELPLLVGGSLRTHSGGSAVVAGFVARIIQWLNAFVVN